MNGHEARDRRGVIRALYRRRPRSRLVRWTALGFTALAIWAWTPRVHLLGMPLGSGEIATA